MFERFTERARQVVVLAQEESRTLKHNYIGTEHVLLALLREEEGVGAKVLAAFGMTAERVRSQIVRIVGEGDTEAVLERSPFTPRAKKVLELALREALALGMNYVGTEHILLGIVRENEGVAARILLDFDLDSGKIRDEIIRVLSGTPKSEQATPQMIAARGVYEVFLGELATQKANLRYVGAIPSPWQFLSEGERRAWRAVAELGRAGS